MRIKKLFLILLPFIIGAISTASAIRIRTGLWMD